MTEKTTRASTEHRRYRGGPYGNTWDLWEDADGYVQTGGTATTLPCDRDPPMQPIGFRGAAPGQSVDARGLPRVRVRAVTA